MSNYYIETDPVGQPIAPLIILANRNGKKIGVLNIDEPSLVIKVELEDAQIIYSELSCDIHKYINTRLNPTWDLIKNFKMICVPIKIPHIKARNLWYEFEVSIDEDDETVKHLTGTLAQYAELNQCYNYEVEIRTEADMEREDYEDTTFYNPDNPDASIVNRVLHDKASHFTISHVDESLWDVKRTFSFNGTSVIDCLKDIAEEVDCIIIMGETDDESDSVESLQYQRTISFYDGKDYCPVCGKRGDFTDGCTNPECDHSQKIIPRYGTDTGIFVSHENLGDGISLSVNTDDIKNCFRVTAGDDIMTTAVINCNPSGSRYIWRFTNEMKADMSDELLAKINRYESDYEDYRYTRTMSGVTRTPDFNTIYTKYEPYIKDKMELLPTVVKGYTNLTKAYYYTMNLQGLLSNTMFPDSPDVVDTTAEEQLALFTATTIGVRSLSSLSKTTMETEIEDTVILYVDDSRYRVDVETTNYENKVWNGTITLTSYTDDEDTATDDFQLTFSQATADFVKSQVDRYIKRKETVVAGVKDLVNLELADFTAELKKYNLDSLSTIQATIKAVLDILDDAGITRETNPDVYDEIYKPYSDKLLAVTAEIAVRDSEIAQLDALLDQILAEQDNVHDRLDLEQYLGDESWLELLSFRRESEQTDTTIISTGLTDAEVLENAQEFFNRMDEDLDKLAEAQYSINCTLKNLLLMLPETYDPYIEIFDIGNWIRIEVDEKIYKMRLLSYEISFDDLTTIETEFSSAKILNDIYSTFRRVQKTAQNADQGLADLSRQQKAINNYTTNIINQITNQIYTPDNKVVATVNGKAVMMNDEESLDEYLRKTIKDTNGNLAITLTNEFQGVPTDENGNGGDYTDCVSQVIVYYGSDEITDSSEISWDVVIPSTMTGSWNATTHTVSVSNLTRDAGAVEIFVEYKGLEVKKSFIVKKIKAASPIIVNIDSSAGNIFVNNTISTTLTCTVTQGNTDITSSVTNFHWIKYDSQGNIDPLWTRGNTSTITLTSADVEGRAVFRCEVTF